MPWDCNKIEQCGSIRGVDEVDIGLDGGRFQGLQRLAMGIDCILI
jgi:hypothetical protein